MHKRVAFGDSFYFHPLMSDSIHSKRINYVDVKARLICEAIITWGQKIQEIEILSQRADLDLPFAIPGLIDAHVHVESSLLSPVEFARMAVTHGTVASVSDPHEIANVLGIAGVEFMLTNAALSPFKFAFGAPSCVPATAFENAGATILASEVDKLLSRPDIYYLSEMMNYPGVLMKDQEVMDKIASSKNHGKPIDGHAPGLMGNDAKQYFAAGISTDHECFKYEEALEKIKLGVKVLIREGSAAKNFEELIPLLNKYPDQIMFCSDDKHPNDFMKGHINELMARARQKGCDILDIICAATKNPIEHYKLPCGLLQEGDPADFIVVENLDNFSVLETYIDGELVAKNQKSLLPSHPSELPNQFNISSINQEDLSLQIKADPVPCIRVLDGQIVTQKDYLSLKDLQQGEVFESNLELDAVKLVVVNRYQNAPVAKAVIVGSGLQNGALASSVAHDSHNIIAMGSNDTDLKDCIQTVIDQKGGLALKQNGGVKSIGLPIAGLMANEDAWEIGERYDEMDQFSKQMCQGKLKSPFMSLSFLALLVIPEIKLSDLGLFDAQKFEFIDL
jgi:adenine deaminase